MRPTIFLSAWIATLTMILAGCSSGCSLKNEEANLRAMRDCAQGLHGRWKVLLPPDPAKEKTMRVLQRKGLDPLVVTMDFDLEAMTATTIVVNRRTEEKITLTACAPDRVTLVSTSVPEAAAHSATLTFVNPDELTMLDETRGRSMTLIRVDRRQENALGECARRIAGTWHEPATAAATPPAASLTFDFDRMVIVRTTLRSTKEIEFRVQSCDERQIVLEPVGQDKARFTFTIDGEGSDRITVRRGKGIEPVMMVRQS